MIAEPIDVLLVATYELGRQPFGLASPAAWLRRAGATVRCVDTAVEPMPGDEVLASARLVAFHVPMHTATRLALPIAARVREVNPGAHVCFFGLYAAMNESLLRKMGAGTVLSGEFETGLVELHRALVEGAARPALAPVSLARQRFEIPDRHALPPLAKYAALRVSDSVEVVAGYTEASRGCKHLCRHCPVVPIYEGRFRIVDVDVVLADVEQQVRAGARHITFGDPDFWNGPGHARTIVEELHRRHPDVTYDVTIKIEHLVRHDEDLPLLRDTSCLFVTTAVESVDDEVLALLDKGHTRADFVRVARRFDELGLVLAPTFVPFTPWTSPEGFQDLLRAIEELDLVEHVSPIQLAIRLLIPAGSRLLELEAVRRIVDPFDGAALCHPWRHVDPRVDRLQADVFALVAKAHRLPRRALFDEVRRLADVAAGRQAAPVPARVSARGRFVPHMTEPWYC